MINFCVENLGNTPWSPSYAENTDLNISSSISRDSPTYSPLVLWIQLILMRIRILDPHWKKWTRILIQVISIKFTQFFNKAEFFKFFVLFFLKSYCNENNQFSAEQIRIYYSSVIRKKWKGYCSESNMVSWYSLKRLRLEFPLIRLFINST